MRIAEMLKPKPKGEITLYKAMEKYCVTYNQLHSLIYSKKLLKTEVRPDYDGKRRHFLKEQDLVKLMADQQVTDDLPEPHPSKNDNPPLKVVVKKEETPISEKGKWLQGELKRLNDQLDAIRVWQRDTQELQQELVSRQTEFNSGLRKLTDMMQDVPHLDSIVNYERRIAGVEGENAAQDRYIKDLMQMLMKK